MARPIAITCLAIAALGCETRRIPPRSQVIDRVDVVGAEKVDGEDVEEKIATSETKRVAGGALQHIPLLTIVDAMTVEYHTFDRYVLERDLERVRRYYRARGFYDAEVRAARVVRTDEGHVRVEIAVEEGLPVVIESVQLEFPEWQQAFDANARMQEIVAAYRAGPVAEGEERPRFDEERYEEVKQALVRALTDEGFAYAEVTGDVTVDVVRRRARVVLRARAGPRSKFGPITFEGLGEIPEGPVRRALGFEEGDEFSTEDIESAQRALADFQVFASVEIQPMRSRPGQPRRTAIPIVVRVQPIKLRAVRIGLGAELGSQVEAHAIVGWEDRNFLGGLRRFVADLRPGLVFFPTRFETIFAGQRPTNILPEAELRLDFKQPAFPESRTNLLLGASGRIYRPRTLPVPEEVPQELIDEAAASGEPPPTYEQFVSEIFNIVGYHEVTGYVGLERNFHFNFLGGNTIYGAQFVRAQFDNPFSYNQEDPPEGFVPVVIPYLESIVGWDFRKGADGKPDPARPHSGVYFGLNMQLAHFGNAEDFRLRPDIRAYAPITSEITLALRWGTGFLFPRNYGESLFQEGAADADRAGDQQLLSYRGFFSGGPNSNRGYGYRDVGPHEILSFFSQRGESDELLPTGGLGLWELSAELRVPIGDDVGFVAFVDSSDVVRTLRDYRFTHLHICPGLGLRGFTPVGIVRFDVGVRVPYLQRLGYKYLEPEEGGPPPGEEDNFPLGLHFAIGEAY